MDVLGALDGPSGLQAAEDEASGDAEIAADLPKAEANKAALDFLNSVTTSDLQDVLFTDSLVAISTIGKELGEFTVTVEPARHHGQECLLIHANSHGTIDNIPIGTSLTAYVSKNLQTLDENHHEYVELEDVQLDKKTHIIYKDGQYILNKIVSRGQDMQRTAETFSEDRLKGFISEGSNLILQRILARKGVPDNLVFVSFDGEAKLWTTTYRGLEDRTQRVGEEEVMVKGIERTINSYGSVPDTWQSYFLPDGHLASRVHVGSPVTMHLLRIPEPPPVDDREEKPTFPKKPLNWEEDMQLYSQFLDRKEELKGDHATYMRHHPELKALLADFLQFLLLRKPEDIVSFAADYFSSFSASTKSGSAFATSQEPRFTPRPTSPYKKQGPYSTASSH
ncbi:ciliogenesis-associated TTC17-interacting protein-like [Lytechinus variegatus]|uniref:ciliogenesis-associated TTC17-interacting protein-like n=1 Tax=Lytechinus variegatus TaxID=7654 RepID=UPI001BB0E31A|nr:ciliogenesis-associated TTC17-interacting protein-like [Lytechinus variegatus]